MAPARSRLVIVIESDDRLRTRIERWLAPDSSGFRCIGAFRDPENALAKMVRVRPEIVVLNFERPETTTECLWQIRANWPETRVLAYPAATSAERLLEALGAGVDWFIDKPIHRADFLSQLRELSPENALLQKARRLLLDHFRAWRPSPGDQPLTPREQTVLALLKEGLADKEIADRLKISPHTVFSHLRNLRRKLHVRSRTEVVLKTIIVR